MGFGFLLTGSNVGNRLSNLKKAGEFLGSELKIFERSKIYESKAWGLKDQDDFLNQILKIQLEKDPSELLKITQGVEEKMGRSRKEKWGPRIIDIDILYLDQMIINESDLVVPHPEIQNRMFTLKPLAELAPDLTHPILKMNQKELLESCEDHVPVWIYQPSIEDTSASL